MIQQASQINFLQKCLSQLHSIFQYKFQNQFVKSHENSLLAFDWTCIIFIEVSACNEGDLGSIPWLGRSPGEGNGNPLQDSCLENSMDQGAWQATVHGVAKSWTRLSDFTFTLGRKKVILVNFSVLMSLISLLYFIIFFLKLLHTFLLDLLFNLYCYH